MIEQLTVFLQNEPGRVAALSRAISEAQSNMTMLTIADTADFGIARIICDRPHYIKGILKEEGFKASITKVVAVSIANETGSLTRLLDAFDTCHLNLEYSYCFCFKDGNAIAIARVDNPEIAQELLNKEGFTLIEACDLYEID